MKKREIALFSLFTTLILLILPSVNAAIVCDPGDSKIDTNPICLDQPNPYVVDGEFCGNLPTDPAGCTDPTRSYCGQTGFYFVEGDALNKSAHVLTLRTPSLPFNEIYNLTFTFRRGPASQNQEGFKIECGGTVYDFPDDPTSTAPEIWEPHHVNCNFNSGVNIINITTQSTDIHSTHFDEFRIEKCLKTTTGSSSIPSTAFPYFTKINVLLTLSAITMLYFLINKKNIYPKNLNK